MRPEIDLFATSSGSVTAPAGCGKTHLIAACLRDARFSKPVLVLTHTNAGAAALRSRLHRLGVSGSSFRVMTLDGFALRLARFLPVRSGLDPVVLELREKSKDYPAIRDAAVDIIRSGHISDPLRATYERVVVDEYQDCNRVQHALVLGLAELMPVAVVGDPMQAIFGFDGAKLVDWNADVERNFPPLGKLSTPWRWDNVGMRRLGEWLIRVREDLSEGRGVDLNSAPSQVEWRKVAASDEQQRFLAAQYKPSDSKHSVLIIGDSKNVRGRHELCSRTPGATAVEAAELADLVAFADEFDISKQDALERLVGMAAEVMTQVGRKKLLDRVGVLLRGRSKTDPSQAEQAAVQFARAPGMAAAVELLDVLESQYGARVFRPETFRALRSGLTEAADGTSTLQSAVIRARERNRFKARVISRRAVGSTLLLKGLESDVAVILYPEKMDARNLYVALTRGARRIVVCSERALLCQTA
jgi:hypothetical protein